MCCGAPRFLRAWSLIHLVPVQRENRTQAARIAQLEGQLAAGSDPPACTAANSAGGTLPTEASPPALEPAQGTAQVWEQLLMRNPCCRRIEADTPVRRTPVSAW